jgi:iron complex outermembrane receptor protein
LPAGFNQVNQAGDRGRRNELEAIHSFLPFADTRLAWGASWRRDTVSSATILRDQGTVSREVWRAFANGEWKPVRWLTGNLGVSNEYDTLAGNHVSPRASLALHLTPENTLRVGYSNAWRTASIRAYRANFREGPAPGDVELVGNSDLPAERLDSWELAYLGDWRAWRMSLDVRHFREKVSDRLMTVRPRANPSPDSEQPIQDITMRGYELQWKWQPLETTRLMLAHSSIRIDSEFSENGLRLTQTPGSNVAGNGVALYTALAEESAPRHASSLLLMQKLPFGLDFSVAHYRVGAMKWTRNTEVDKYYRTDARLGYPFRIGGQRGEIAYTVQSLDGDHIEQRKGRSEPTQRVVDRRHWISLRFDF